LVGGMVGSNCHGRFRLITFKFEFAGSAGVISGGSQKEQLKIVVASVAFFQKTKKKGAMLRAPW
jgi:hypothetical protein